MFKNLRPQALGVWGAQSELIEWTLSFGFRGLEPDLTELLSRVKTSGVAQARRLFDSAKLRLGTFLLPIDWEAGDAEFDKQLAELAANLATLAEAGCQRAVSWIAPASAERPYHENFETHRKRIARVAELLATHKLPLALGFHAAPELRVNRSFEFIHGLDALLILVQTVGAANVGLVVDPWEVAVAGGSIEDLKKIPAERWIALDLADAPADAPLGDLSETQRLLPGETGVIDCAAVLTLAAERGFEGPVTPVPHRQHLAGQKRDQAIKLAGQKLDDLWRAAGLNAAGKLTPSVAS